MLELTTENFDKEVLQSEEPVLVDFWAAWCGPCVQMAPVMDAMAEEYKKKGIKIVKLNVDDHGDAATPYSVLSIPTFILFRNGKEAGRLVGAVPRQKIEDLLSK